MKDDYLWDKSGQPDPDIQKLEEILGTLRYQPRPLELPVSRRRSYFPLLAIAASLLLALLAGGIWLRVRNQSVPQPQRAEVIPAPAPPAVEEKKPEQAKPVVPQEVVAVNTKRRHKPVAPPSLSTREREEALLAKEQLMMALRLTTEKLSLVHRKSPNTNQIKNQHRVG